MQTVCFERLAEGMDSNAQISWLASYSTLFCRKLIERFVELFGKECIEAVVADREFKGVVKLFRDRINPFLYPH
jgi:hypothetical protein